MPLPTFLIVGAQKSGTSSLVKTLRQHSQVQLSRPKELHFFDVRRDRGLDWYADHFEPGPETRQWGESTPAYMYFASARAGIGKVLPDAKLVAILRDPVKRAYSHFWHAKRTGRERAETFEEGLALENERLTKGPTAKARFSYTDRGYYVDQLEDLTEQHDPDNLHVMLLDDLTHARVPTLERLLEFLDVDPGEAQHLDEVWAYRYRFLAGAGEDPQGEHYAPMITGTRRRLAQLFESHNRRLEDWLERDLSHWVRA